MSIIATIDDTETEFLTAILAEPEDDTARLVYADWLDEHGGFLGNVLGGARAKFIRGQVADWHSGDREPLKNSDSMRRDIVRDKPHQHMVCGSSFMLWIRPHWTGDSVPKMHPLLMRELGFTRGFVSHFRGTVEEWIVHSWALYWHPDEGRPFQATAHPISTVTLTGTCPNREGQISYLKQEWPRIGFSWASE